MDKDQALMMAIKLLEGHLMDLVYQQDAESEYESNYLGKLIVLGEETIAACREALEQPTEEIILV